MYNISIIKFVHLIYKKKITKKLKGKFKIECPLSKWQNQKLKPKKTNGNNRFIPDFEQAFLYEENGKYKTYEILVDRINKKNMTSLCTIVDNRSPSS